MKVPFVPAYAENGGAFIFSGRRNAAVPVLSCEHLFYRYPGEARAVLEDLSFSVERGEWVALLGANGSGKTTLGRLFCALLPPEDASGTLSVCGLDALSEENRYAVRRACGMVFQNPETQFAASEVGEDLAFGPRNFGVPEEEIPERIASALETVGLPGYETRLLSSLSGGQKQRAALAGVLCCDPEILICDEASSMLDAEGREAFRDVLSALHRAGKTIFCITHDPEEALFADRAVLLRNGRSTYDGGARNLLASGTLLREAGIAVPPAVELTEQMAANGVSFAGLSPEKKPLDGEELCAFLCR